MLRDEKRRSDGRNVVFTITKPPSVKPPNQEADIVQQFANLEPEAI